MPCAEIYLFGCASVVDQTGRSGTGCKFAVDAAELESCAKLKPLRRRSIETERSMEPPGTAEEFSRKRATYSQIIPPDVRFQVWNLPLPPGSIVQKGVFACVDDSVQNKPGSHQLTSGRPHRGGRARIRQ